MSPHPSYPALSGLISLPFSKHLHDWTRECSYHCQGSASPESPHWSHTLSAKQANRCPGSFKMNTCRRQNPYQLLQNCIFTWVCGMCSSCLGGNYSEYCLGAVCHQNQSFLSIPSSLVISFATSTKNSPHKWPSYWSSPACFQHDWSRVVVSQLCRLCKEVAPALIGCLLGAPEFALSSSVRNQDHLLQRTLNCSILSHYRRSCWGRKGSSEQKCMEPESGVSGRSSELKQATCSPLLIVIK